MNRYRIDPLGTLLGAAGAAAAIFLPFVVLKANRIVPGEGYGLGQVLPGWELSLCVLA
ncbi:MAG: hypothetical protein JO361_03155, partial [Gammaproteobacteria bacterium]|nr:hypothetical protein [Gammaproteobacteria bacterium]